MGETSTPDTKCSSGEIVMFGQDWGFPSTITTIATGSVPVYAITSQATYGNTTIKLNSYIGSSGLNTRTDSAIDVNDIPATDPNGAAGLTITSDPALPHIRAALQALRQLPQFLPLAQNSLAATI